MPEAKAAQNPVWLREFLTYLRAERGLSALTLGAYRADILKYLAYLKTH